MILVSSTVFWILLAIGLLCAIGMIITSVWYKKLAKPTEVQTKKYRLIFQSSFLGFLVFGFTPIFLWLLFLPG